jgi:hypothetical protein
MNRVRTHNSSGDRHWSNYLRNNSTVFEELEVSIVDLMVANTVLLATRSGASKTDICDRQIHNWHWQLFKYSTVIPILMKFSKRVHTSLKKKKKCTFQIPSAKKNSPSNPQLTPTTLQIQYCYSYSYEILPLNRQLMQWNFQIQYSYLHSNAILNIKMHSCISQGLKITQIKIPRNIVERLWHINNVTSYEDFQFKM